MSWIDFKRLREQLDFAQVLRHYRVEFKMKGERATAFCPFPGHKGRRRSPSFSADLKRGLFQCFGCGEKGNILEFACLMENVDPQNTREFHRVAAMLQERFVSSSPARPDLPQQKNGRTRTQRRGERPPQKRDAGRIGDGGRQPRGAVSPVVINPSLDFELKNLDPEHPYLANRGFTPETVKHFGLGFCNRGSLKERIAIPLHDSEGKLIGYAGRVVDDTLIGQDNPKYLFPGDRERDGKRIEFRKSLFLYNGYGIRKPVQDLLVVEGFPATWWLWQNGVSNVVALMGSSCSKEQGALIVDLVEPTGSVWVFTDGDDAGRRCAGNAFLQIGPYRFMRLVRCEEGKQPTDWTPEELLGSFGAEESGQSDEPIGASLDGEGTDEGQGPTAAQ